MSIYPGNPSLGDEVKQRILVTYQQSLDLAERGRREEALLGCDFVLELDPQFAPARTLRERLANGGPEPPAVGAAETAAEPEQEPWSEPEPEAPPADSGSAGERLEESFEGLFGFDATELPELEESPAFAAVPEPAAPPPASGQAFRERLEARDYRGVLDLAAQERDAVTADPELAGLVETAQARLEALPYVESFLKEAGTAVRAGDPERARLMLEKARSLDPGHPLLADLEGALSAGAEAVAAPEAPAVPEAGEVPAAEEPELLGGYELGSADDAGGEGRIGELLREGQEAADRGDLQGAIDAWSRIFLIDVDHEEAARRIEGARRVKAEREREVEEVFHEGLTALEQGDREAAQRRFERVLEVQPGHLAARDYLRQMESGEPLRVAAGPSSDDTVALSSLGSFDLSDLAAPREGAASAEELKEEILVPPPPGGLPAEEEAAPKELPSYGKAAVGREPGRRTFLWVGGLVLVVVVAAAVYVFLNKDRWFPNSEVEEPAAEASGGAEGSDAVERAAELHERGQTAMALGLLRRIRPEDPRYAEAQELIARWEAPDDGAATEETEAVAPQALARRERLLAAAGTAFEGGEYLLSDELLDRAAKIAALDGEALELDQAVDRQLTPLAAEITLFREGEYELVLPRLWRLHQAEPDNRDVRRMLVNSYYNRGVRQLQRGDPTGAARELEEALELAPDDADLRRHHLFAQSYEGRPRDLLYRIYVKYLPFR